MIVNPGKLKAIEGEEKTTGVTLLDGTSLPVNGVFVVRPAVAPSALVKGIELNGADIVVDRSQMTNKPGMFAAGDCTGRP